MVGTYKGAVARAKQELGLDKRSKQRIAHCPIQSPQPLRLRDSQAKTRHLDVLPLHTSKDVERLFFDHYWTPLGCLDESPPPAN